LNQLEQKQIIPNVTTEQAKKWNLLNKDKQILPYDATRVVLKTVAKGKKQNKIYLE
jgi:hypothetical protein